MLRVLLVAGIAAGMTATAADLGGRWSGTVNAKERSFPIYLTLDQRGRDVSGGLTFGQTPKITPIQKPEIAGDELMFEVRNDAGKLFRFTLTSTVIGHPLGDRQVVLKGRARAGEEDSDVVLYPTREESTSLGGGVASAPVLIHKVEPVYDERARETNVRGTVVLQVEVEPTGTISPGQIRVLRGLGHGLDERAVECVTQWRFTPAFRNGYAVGARVSVEVSFKP